MTHGPSAVGRRRRVAVLPGCVVLSLLAGCEARSGVITRGGLGSYDAALAIVPDGLVAAWYDERDGNAEIYMRQLTPEGRPADVERRLTADAEQSYAPRLDAAGRHVAVAWYGSDADGTLTARLGLWTLDGRKLWADTLSAGSRNPIVRVGRDRLFCAWIEADPSGGEAMWAAWWHVDGHRLGSRRRLGPAGPTTRTINAAVDAGGAAWVVFDARVMTWREELYLARVGQQSQSIIRLTADDGRASRYPDIAVEHQRVAIAWIDERHGGEDVLLTLVDAADVSRVPAMEPMRVTSPQGAPGAAYLAWNRDVLGLVWSEGSQGRYHVYVQSFTARGRPLIAPRRVATTGAMSWTPSIRGWKRGFALAWNAGSDPRPDARRPSGGHSGVAVRLFP